jgi:hypothetical protein
MPLTRFTPANPYASRTHTKFQLDMRRKAEILKYSSNKLSTQTNNLTKSQKYALLVRGRLPPVSQSLKDEKTQNPNTKIICDSSQIQMPTTSSNVPGKVMNLYLDETVPLYNYSNFNARTYSNYVPTDSDPWQFVVLNDVPIGLSSNTANNENVTTGNIYHLIIRNNINEPKSNFKIVTPISLSVSGETTSSSITLTDASLSVFYNTRFVKSIRATYESKINFSWNNITTSSTQPYSNIKNLVFDDVLLYTVATYAYTFTLNMNIDLSFNGNATKSLVVNPAGSGASISLM